MRTHSIPDKRLNMKYIVGLVLVLFVVSVSAQELTDQQIIAYATASIPDKDNLQEFLTNQTVQQLVIQRIRQTALENPELANQIRNFGQQTNTTETTTTTINLPHEEPTTTTNQQVSQPTTTITITTTNPPPTIRRPPETTTLQPPQTTTTITASSTTTTKPSAYKAGDILKNDKSLIDRINIPVLIVLMLFIIILIISVIYWSK